MPPIKKQKTSSSYVFGNNNNQDIKLMIDIIIEMDIELKNPCFKISLRGTKNDKKITKNAGRLNNILWEILLKSIAFPFSWFGIFAMKISVIAPIIVIKNIIPRRDSIKDIGFLDVFLPFGIIWNNNIIYIKFNGKLLINKKKKDTILSSLFHTGAEFADTSFKNIIKNDIKTMRAIVDVNNLFILYIISHFF